MHKHVLDRQVFAYDKQKTFLKLARKSACQGMFVWVASLYTMKDSQAFIKDDHLGILANVQTCARQTVCAYDLLVGLPIYTQ